jgi:NodT family efflux transporter outer membrane factor (OMF) lipoprotein
MFNAGCLKLTTPPRTVTDLPVPAAYSLASATNQAGDRWWEDFNDPLLNKLIHQALHENLTLQGYRARLTKARAQAVKTGATLYPSLSGFLEAGAGRRHDNLTDRTTGTENYAAGLFASYEVDLWGRLAAQRQSAVLTADASREDLKAAAMTIAAETASRWIGIIAQQEQKKLLATQLSTNQTYLSLVELRFRQSLASALDVLQQQQLVENIRAQLPLVDLQERLLAQELAVLLGNWPTETIDPGRSGLPELPALPGIGLPVQLLENRPDLQSAFYRLRGADQDLLASKADLLPALSLTANAGFDSDRVRALFDDWLANLLASLTAPLIDGGRRRAEVAITEAAIQEQLAAYRQLILVAIQEVEEALSRETLLTENLRGVEKQLQIAKHALAEARSRYLNGLTDYLPVLTQLLAVQSLEKDLLTRRGEILLVRISLYRALGGSWTDHPSTPPVQNELELEPLPHDGTS